MEYLDIVNAVLKRLRETTVASISQTAYSAMVGAFVNDAKEIVEGAWDWSSNRMTISVATVASTSTYSLTGAGDKLELMGAWNNTSQCNLVRVDEAWYKNKLYTGGVSQEGSPVKFTFTGPDSNGDAQVVVYPTPDAVYDLKFWIQAKQAELSAADDVMRIPSKPVILHAVAMLAEEKGETGGMTSKRYFEMAEKVLNDSIAYDAAKSPRETDWRVT